MNLALTRRLAVVQAYIEALDRVRHNLADLSDMQALRQLKSDFTVYLARKVSEGEVPADPLYFVTDEIDRITRGLEVADQVYREFTAIGAELLQPQPRSLSYEGLLQSMAKLNEAEAALPGKLDAALEHYRNVHRDDELEALPGSYEVALAVAPDSPMHIMPAPDLFEMVYGRGPFYESVVTHLDSMRAQCNFLLEQHEVHRIAVEICSDAATKGNYLKARQSIRAFKPIYSDIEYERVEELAKRCDDWLLYVRSLVDKHRDMVERWRIGKKFLLPWEVVKQRGLAQEKLNSFRRELTEFKNGIGAKPRTDFDREALALIDELLSQISKYEVSIKRYAAKAIQRTSLKLGLGIFLLFASCFGTYSWLKPSKAQLQAMDRMKQQDEDAAKQSEKVATPGQKLSADGKPQFGNLEVAANPVRARYTIFDGTNVLREGTAETPPPLITDLPAKELTIEFRPLDSIPYGPVRQALSINPNATKTINVPFGVTREKEWIGSDFKNRFKQPMYWDGRTLRWICGGLITRAAYEEVVGACPTSNGDPTDPVQWVTLAEARQFCEKLTALERSQGRLPRDWIYVVPTDQEWAVFGLDSFERLETKKLLPDGTARPRTRSSDSYPIRELFSYDKSLEGELVDTEYDETGNTYVLAGALSLSSSRIGKDHRDRVGFRIALTQEGHTRYLRRLVRNPGFSVKVEKRMAQVISIDPDCPAAQAGLRLGDQILQANRRIPLNEDFFKLIYRGMNTNSRLRIQISRAGSDPTWLEFSP